MGLPLGGHILKEILSLANLFQSLSFSHVVRQGNTVAHALAQRARLSFPFQVWMMLVPFDVFSFLALDSSIHE